MKPGIKPIIKERTYNHAFTSNAMATAFYINRATVVAINATKRVLRAADSSCTLRTPLFQFDYSIN